MIQLSAPSISANAAPAAGTVPTTAANGTETADFAALLGAAGTPGETAAGEAKPAAAALTAALAVQATGNGGKDGKATGNESGKDLPVAANAAAAAVAAAATVAAPTLIKDAKPTAETAEAGEGKGEAKTTDAPDEEATSDQADVPIAAANPVMPLVVPPLPGTDNPVEFRAAVPDTAAAGRSAASLSALVQGTATPARNAGTKAQAAAPAQVLQVKLAPIVTTDAAEAGKSAQAPTDLNPVAAIMARIDTAKAAAAATPAGQVAPATTGKVQIAGLQATALPVQTDAAPRTEAKAAANRPFVEAPAAKPADIDAPVVSAKPAAASTAQVATATTGKTQAPGLQATALPVQTDAALRTEAKANTASEVIADPGKKDIDTAQSASQPATRSAVQPAAMHFASAQPAVSTAPAIATVPGAAPTAVEQPHDFTTLVDRLSEAREAASPQVVRTAINHAEFGQVSMQFRQDDAKMSVTLTNADPGFTSAVHSAVAATLAGNAAGNGDQQRSDSQQAQQQQQQQASTQQQSAASSNGQGQGQAQQQAAQARAEQGERNFHRAQSASAGAQQGERKPSDGAANGPRRSGIYA